MQTEGHVFSTSENIPRLSPPSPLEKIWLTAKQLLFIASDKDRERLGQ
ncbi:hypothetical protein K2P56_00755 [Patescibacteria group bacterium]|nr:hypothetical protein [Patescibacteria group bacterium]